MEFNHTEQTDERLFNKIQELLDEKKGFLSDRRRKEIGLEMACIVFEQGKRYEETHPHHLLDVASST